jgi:hypothetical protein
MPNNQVNVTKTNRGDSAPLLLLRLMLDLEVLANELWTAEETTGQPVSTYRDPLAERLRRGSLRSKDRRFRRLGPNSFGFNLRRLTR